MLEIKLCTRAATIFASACFVLLHRVPTISTFISNIKIEFFFSFHKQGSLLCHNFLEGFIETALFYEYINQNFSND